MRLAVRERSWTLREPLVTTWGTLATRTVLEVDLVGADGVVGHGEAAPLEPYDGVALDAVRAALEAYAPVLERAGDALRGDRLVDACRERLDLPQAYAALDLALWDRAGRRAGRPVAALLTDDPAPDVAVNATIGAPDRAGAATAAAAAREAGFGCVKVKVGTGDDPGRLAAVRAAGGAAMALRLDANGAWTVDEAVRTIDALAPAGLELVEEPVHGIAELRAVRERVATRIALDETGATPGALAAGVADVADAVCLKVSRSGGIASLLVQAALVRAGGAEVYLASTFDGPRGIAAAVHCAAALQVTLPCGLATLGAFRGLGDPLPIRAGRIAVPTGPGLGVL